MNFCAHSHLCACCAITKPYRKRVWRSWSRGNSSQQHCAVSNPRFCRMVKSLIIYGKTQTFPRTRSRWQAKPRKNHCFGYGHDNPQGIRLKFSLDEESRQAICHFKLSRKYTGPPGHAHGGIIATILDEAMGKVNKFRNVLALTGSMEIKYL